MYPERQLNHLAARKTALRRRIFMHRVECADAAATLAAPLGLLDSAFALIGRIGPVVALAAVPIGALVARSESRTLKFLASVARWAPVVLGAMGSG